MYTFGDVFGPIINIINIMPPRQHLSHNMATWKIAAYRVAAIVVFAMCLPILETIHILMNPELEEIILFKSIFIIIGNSMAALRQLPINLNTTAIIKLFKQYENLYNALENSDQIQSTLKIMYYVTRGVVFVIIAALICIVVGPAFNDPPFSTLPLPGILNIDTSTSPNYQIIYIYQIIIELPRFLIFCVSTFVMLGLMYATRGLFHELKNNLRSKNLEECIKFHQEILRLFDEFESLFAISTLVSLALTMVFLAIMAYYISIMTLCLDTFGFTLISFAMINELLLYNYCGNEIAVQHEALRHTLYTRNWYKCLNKKNYMQETLILMQRFNRQLQFRAGKIYPLSLATFVAIMKTTYTYFTILRNVNQ